MKRTFISLAAAVVATAVFAPAANADVINGSFEADFQAANTWSIYSNLTGWTGGAGGIELRNNVSGAAHSGVNYIELDTNYNSLASQVLTTSGLLYNLSFAYSAREGISESSNGIDVYWNNALVGSYTGVGSNSGNNWTVYNLTVLGTNPTSLLEFRAVGTSDSYGGSLDSISLNVARVVPEPATLGLLGLGLIGLGLARRRKTQA
jgi:hypothetical protein